LAFGAGTKPPARPSAKPLERGAFTSTAALEAAINAYIAENNANPKPFVWPKTVDEVFASLANICQRTPKSDH
jgi:hypothetical protein